MCGQMIFFYINNLKVWSCDKKLYLSLAISYQEPFIFSISIACFQIFTLQFILWPNMRLIPVISNRLEFWKNRKCFCFSPLIFNY